MIIRRKNVVGNIIAVCITIIAWFFILSIVVIGLLTYCRLYSDSLVVLQLILGMNASSIDAGLETVMICFVVMILPVLIAIVSSHEVSD